MSASNWDETLDYGGDAADSKAAAVLPQSGWSLATRIAFRFAFSYLLLYNLPFPFNVFWKGADKLYEEGLCHTVVSAVAKRFFGITIEVFTNGSGDTTYDYIKIVCFAVIAAAAALVWSILDRRRPSYTRLYEWLRIYVRFTLAASLVGYGAYKVIQAQFPSPTIDRMLQPFGDASPMGLLWTFMSASAAYNFFSGASEMLGGVLLAFRRTTLLGALVSIAVMTNIVMLNFCYDVPVKTYSVHLLAMSVFLVIPDTRRLIRFFLTHQPPPLVQPKWLRVAGAVLGAALVLYISVTGLQEARDAIRQYAQPSPLRGVWNVDTLVVDGVNRPPLLTDEQRWRRIVFDKPDVIAFYPMTGRRKRYGLKFNPLGRMELTDADPKWKAVLNFKRPDPKSLVVDGLMDGKQIHAVLHKTGEETAFRLTTRGFHWINEYPFNR